MAHSSNITKNWNFYSTHYSPANASDTSNQTVNSDQEDIARSRRSSSEYLPYGRQRSVFPYGIVSEYDLKDTIGAETNDNSFSEKPDSRTGKWRSSPCLDSSSNSRWGTRILQTPCRGSKSADGEPSWEIKPRSRLFRERLHSCPSTPMKDFLRVEIPVLSSIMVHAQSLPLVSRPTQSHIPSRPKPSSAPKENTRRLRAESVGPVIERPKKTAIESQMQGKEREISKRVSEIKIEDGVIIIDNGKVIDLKEDKRSKKHKMKTSEAAAKSRSYRDFQDAMQKFEDAQLNLEGEVKSKAKTFETKDKEQDFFNEHVQTQFLDLLSSVKDKRKKNKGKKYRC